MNDETRYTNDLPDQKHTDTPEETSGIFDDATKDDLQGRRPKVPIGAQLTVLAVALLVIFSTGIIPKLFNTPTMAKDEVRTSTPTPTSQASSLQQPAEDALEDVEITGKSAFVWDIKQQKALYMKNPDEQLPLASVTKLMTALLAYEIIAKDDTVTITDQAIWQDGDSGLRSGEYFNFKDLLDMTLMSSSNDGAFALASAAGSFLDKDEPTRSFIRAMNIRAEELGLTQTYFRNPTGLDISKDKAGAYGSARDISFLLEHILKEAPDIVSATTKNTDLVYNTSGQYHESANTNPVINQIPGIIASKTGYTTLAGGNLTIAFDAGLDRPVIVTVLGSTRNDRFYDVLKLAKAAQEAIAAQANE